MTCSGGPHGEYWRRQAKSRFSELISRAGAGERFLIEQRERPVAVLISADELERLERPADAAHHLARALGQSAELLERIKKDELHPAMMAFGLWRDDAELDDMVPRIYENRRGPRSRPEVDL